MKAFINAFVYTSLVLLILSCQDSDLPPNTSVQNASTQEQAEVNSLLGTWKNVTYKFTRPDGTIVERDSTDRRELKLITPTHYSWFMQSANGEFGHAGIGTYSYDGENYIEHVIYTEGTGLAGQTVINRVEWQGPDKWIQYGETENGAKVEIEFIRIE